MRTLLDDPATDLLQWVLRQETRNDGASVARRGGIRYNNPYSYGTKEFDWWLEGFDDPQSCYVSPFTKAV